MKKKPSQEVIVVSFKKKLRRHFCNKPGHYEELVTLKGQAKLVQVQKKTKIGSSKVTFTQDDDNNDSESIGLVCNTAGLVIQV